MTRKQRGHLLLGVALAVTVMSCAATVSTAPRVEAPTPSAVEEPGSVDIRRYDTPPMPDLTGPAEISVRNVLADAGVGTDAAVVVLRQGNRYELPFNAVCLNGPAEAVIETAFAEQARTCRNDMRRAVAEVNAQALRDIALLQSDARTTRELLTARVAERTSALQSAERVIASLRSSAGGSIWVNVALATAGIVLGAGLSALYLLLTTR